MKVAAKTAPSTDGNSGPGLATHAVFRDGKDEQGPNKI